MNVNSYLFYDIETTGINKCFDQVVQFAAIRTDLNLNEISRYEYVVKLRPDVIPAPKAAITHLISLDRLVQAESEYTVIKKIHELLNEPDTISLGYNTLGFDDEFLRFSFYRNLLDPYSHQYANGCSRMDLYPMVALYYLYCPTVLQWPQVNGQPSLRLENLSALNQLAEGQAHDAMVDVEATVALAKRLMHEKATWDYLCNYFIKREDQNRLLKLPRLFDDDSQSFLAMMIAGEMGTKVNYQAPALLLGEHYHYKNQTVWLRLDQEYLKQITISDFSEKIWVKNKKYGEPPFVLPLTEKRLAKMSKEQLELYQENKNWILNNKALLQEIREYYLDYKYPEHENVDAMALLYQSGFYNYREKNWIECFHDYLLGQQLYDHAVPSERLGVLSDRLAGYENKILANDPRQQLFDRYVDECWQVEEQNARRDYKGECALTVGTALAEITQLEADNGLSSIQQTRLAELKAYILGKIEVRL
ncbi:Exodeoxyribonuclease I [Piscirickettsia salmonis]|uniref:Exonuclease n=1 Tax=Piscirickettsia salmonis TaxID=1238 RepID=A0AAC8ZN83_PISSA|nr:exonuclease [Piscirickettsia salmonis LF-89 = ATCC VR-1361]ALB21420.1 exonuclease [Piscirickettsia salmonis]ALY01652.1 exonuclease [Piscirickettsia salmonis]AMA41164.1 exonuclease [Piscirickettsia salmonis]AOS36353.1 exonuclease [Piscirickettsia salmonis]